ncbi:MAG TPA: tyrosine-type recombinase/integrase [Actinophytocola sp.]|uniref:tyrosine-type recombinase/integrase n=1 Tax=Actinophytocola sp. TaxID=1872138 RepID=UPI002DDD3CB3|nr:tyrosine-type recombinase/integrase [Actinophytocola sp.]HEV2784677.1 tyrosine-type recombinase/integrase [Actinophytocola sp.]
MGYTKDLWTRPEEQPDGKVKRVPNSRWGKGKRYLACWLDPDGRERSQAFTTKRPADKHWQKMETDRDRGEYHDPKAGRADFDGIAQRWLKSRVVDPSSKIRYESVYRLHVKPVFGGAVKRIRASDVQMFQAELGERLGPSTVAAARLVLLGILDLAVEDQLIKKNPARSRVVDTVSVDDGEKIQAWSSERVFKLIDGHPESLRLLPTIGATAGLREGELFGLAWEDIDFDEQVIHVRRQLKKLGRHTVYALPKNDRERVVPLPAWTAESIRVYVAKYKPVPLTLPWEKPDGKPRTHNVLFRWIDGGHMKPRAYSETVWKPALVAAKIIPEPTKDKRGRRRYVTTRREGTHQLRHHYASVMLAGGVNIKELSEYLGHADPGFTLRIYAHMLPDSHERARKVIDERMFRPRAVADGT